MLSPDLCDGHLCQFVREFRYRGNMFPILRSLQNLRANVRNTSFKLPYMIF